MQTDFAMASQNERKNTMNPFSALDSFSPPPPPQQKYWCIPKDRMMYLSHKCSDLVISYLCLSKAEAL